MSAGGAFGGNRGVRPVPPEKGVFPLDHLHECDLEKKDYLACLKSTRFQSEKCRQFSKKYLECRMESDRRFFVCSHRRCAGRLIGSKALVDSALHGSTKCQIMRVQIMSRSSLGFYH
ncbi:unnamed protein product [Urochloa humidicola]